MAQVEGAQRTAAKERQTLAVLIGALMPHKASLALVPQESVASTLSRFGSCGLPPEQEHSGSAGMLLRLERQTLRCMLRGCYVRAGCLWCNAFFMSSGFVGTMFRM